MISENGDFILLNYIILGAKRVGKTSIINQYCIKSWRKNDNIFRTKNIMFDGVKFKIQFWEQNSYSKSRLEYYNPYELFDALLIIIDLGNQNSIQEVYYYYERLRLIRFKDMKPIIIVANKCDLRQRQDIFIFPREIQNQLGLQYFEVTAKDYFTINTMFETIFLQCVGFYISQSKIKQSNLSQYYQDQNNGLQLCILEYQMKSKIYIAISVFFASVSILCFYNINNIISLSIEGTIYGLIIFFVILIITILSMRRII